MEISICKNCEVELPEYNVHYEYDGYYFCSSTCLVEYLTCLVEYLEDIIASRR